MHMKNGTELITIAEPTLRRLPMYYQYLIGKRNLGIEFISCTNIANDLRQISIQVRKDLQMAGVVGKPKVGYCVEEIIKIIGKFLGYDNINDAFLVGAGNLGKGLLGYKGFDEYGFNIVAVFDSDSSIIGKKVLGKTVMDIANFAELVTRMKIQIGIIAVPREYAHEISSLMVDSGIKAIWNFAPVHLNVPNDILVQNENLAASLSILLSKLSSSLENNKI